MFSPHPSPTASAPDSDIDFSRFCDTVTGMSFLTKTASILALSALGFACFRYRPFGTESLGRLTDPTPQSTDQKPKSSGASAMPKTTTTSGATQPANESKESAVAGPVSPEYTTSDGVAECPAPTSGAATAAAHVGGGEDDVYGTVVTPEPILTLKGVQEDASKFRNLHKTLLSKNEEMEGWEAAKYWDLKAESADPFGNAAQKSIAAFVWREPTSISGFEVGLCSTADLSIVHENDIKKMIREAYRVRLDASSDEHSRDPQSGDFMASLAEDISESLCATRLWPSESKFRLDVYDNQVKGESAYKKLDMEIKATKAKRARYGVK